MDKTKNPNQYLTAADAAEILQVSKRTIERRMPAMRAKGLKVLKFGQLIRLDAASFFRVLNKAAAREEPLD